MCTVSRMEKIYFLHIPKTAGSSFKRILSSMYPENEVLEFYQRDKLLSFNPQKHRLLLGHLGFDISTLTQNFDVVTFLRCPIKRAISNYHQVLRSTEHYLHELVKELGSFSAFIRDKRCQDCIANIQTKYLGLDISFSELIKYHTEASLIALTPQELHSKLLSLSDENIIKGRAFERLSNMAFFGLCERFDDSVSLFQKCYPQLGGGERERAQLNVTRDGVKLSDLSSEDLIIIKNINYLDMHLYENAVSLFNSRLESVC